MTPMTTAEPERARLVEFSRELGRVDRAWALLAEGNTSLLLPTAAGDPVAMLVKASGASMARATPGDFVRLELRPVLDLVDGAGGGDAEVDAVFDAAARAGGGRRPSVEAILHAVCLDLPGVTAVGHTHPVPVNALLCSASADALTRGSLFPDQIVVLGTRPLLVPYIDPGLQLARVVRTMLREHIEATGRVPKVVYLQNHGMFAIGADAAEVLRITEMAVKVAEVLLGSLAAGGPVYLSEEAVARIDTRPDELHRRAELATSTSTPSADRAAAAREGDHSS
ncbi:class II aldolase/adducin family protein [Plantibacter flavus]|uniref:class II aldolase/adducin family protein n=1 Tax=Plantibacter flavus TaxID=150123 RepID=UPI003F152662